MARPRSPMTTILRDFIRYRNRVATSPFSKLPERTLFLGGGCASIHQDCLIPIAQSYHASPRITGAAPPQPPEEKRTTKHTKYTKGRLPAVRSRIVLGLAPVKFRDGNEIRLE